MRNTDDRIMYDCFTSSHSVYFEEAFDSEFREQYKGVIVNAQNYSEYGHFAIRKPITFWSKLPKFIKKIFPYKYIMLKNEKEKMYSLSFCDNNRSISITGDIKNPSFRTLTFDKHTYEDLKSCIPPFLQSVSYKFETKVNDDVMTLIFEPVTETERPKANKIDL